MVDEEDRVDEPSPSVMPPSAPPPIVTEVQRREGRQWPILLVSVVLALLVALIVVLGGRWVYHKVHKQPVANQTETSYKSPPTPPATKKHSTTSNSHKSSSSSSSSRSSSSTSHERSAASRNRQITNTGPGETIALFVGVSTVAGGLHYLYHLRRSNLGF